MSSETTQSSYVTSVSYSFVLKWILKGKDLNNPPKTTANATVILSDLYLFKTAKDLRFYLEIEKYSYGSYGFRIKGSKTWSFDIAYAFLVSKENAFYLKAADKLSFLSSFNSCNILDEEDITIHCLVIADSFNPPPSTKEEDPSTLKDDLYLKEGLTTLDIEVRSNITLPEYYSNKMVIDFIRRGDIPKFDVNMAIQIIRETKEHKCEVLKILCIHYLMQNISGQSLRQISRAALDYRLPVLERACMERIANGYIQTK